MFLQGRLLHCDDRLLYVGAWSQLNKVYTFIYLGASGKSSDLDKVYVTVTGQWFENKLFDVLNPTAMITIQAGCNTGKSDAIRDLNRPTFYGE